MKNEKIKLTKNERLLSDINREISRTQERIRNLKMELENHRHCTTCGKLYPFSSKCVECELKDEENQINERRARAEKIKNETWQVIEITIGSSLLLIGILIGAFL